MAATTKLIAMGDSVGVILPSELLAGLGVEIGDAVYLSESQSGLQVAPCDQQLPAKIETADSGVRQDGDAFEKLAE